MFQSNKNGTRAEVSRDFAMRCDQPGGCGESLVFRIDDSRMRAEIGQRFGVGMQRCRDVELRVQLAKRPALHEHVEGSPAEVTAQPEVRQ